MLSHRSVTASHLSPALWGLKQKRKRMRLVGRSVPGTAPSTSSQTARHLRSPAAGRPGRPVRARKVARDGAAEGKAMAGLRLRGCRVSDLSELLLLLLLWPPVTPGTTCATPTSIEHADIRIKSYNENSRERYICNSGFKRKAGTSSLTKCQRDEATNITRWTIPSLKCIKPAFTSKSDTTVATKPAIVPGSRLTPSQPPSAGTTGVVRNEPSQVPSQTTAKALEHTPSSSLEKPGAYSHDSRTVAVAISVPVAVLCGVCLVFLVVCYVRPRQTPRRPSVEMENMEDMPMTGRTNGREDTEN
ncbi:PREDICTED: interleukin-15 receptor subunit alpha isoform X1 [Hipposideros armiger]|uniref:Interleukin-15 receptor subunit alpha n=1 Tax=Hipposideros armiger TaxID=186990 RepID=A0A8B7RGB9_HIPAR|nr:PREDICTED: interleukin-15 receptor subunit alpha isoform X1 [Hipposideros armiger]